MSTAVGNITAYDSGDTLDLSTKNGNVEVSGARAKLHAESLNGRISVRSGDFGGDWDIYSAVGDIELFLPLTGNYTVEGSSGYGDIVTDLPGLVIDKKSAFRPDRNRRIQAACRRKQQFKCEQILK
ncbi:DUF4097 family beta strand repeat-containing protein [Paenibacillus rhizoplanae]